MGKKPRLYLYPTLTDKEIFMKRLHIGDYDINIGSGLLDRASNFFRLDRRVLIVTDSGVPTEYAKRVAAPIKESRIYTVPEGEGAKSIAVYEALMREAADFELGRGDLMIAVGGGVVGDLTGFAASTYMRGIDFYSVPTTLLSQVDSSVGGKCAINLGGIKNIVGSFYRPRGVLIDTDTLKTLPKRQFSAGLCEAIKMAATSNRELFEYFENNDVDLSNIEYVITEALKIKAAVVEEDEHEAGLRKILNFGHTLGHGIESVEGLSGLYHGECVALGMIPMTHSAIRKRVVRVLEKFSLPTVWQGNIDTAIEFAHHDKKCGGGKIDTILVNEIGSFEIRKMTTDEFGSYVKAELSR